MKEQLTIRNFGPIKDVTINIGRVTVLIGDQATGKTTIAKLLSMCRFFSYIVESPFPAGLSPFGVGLAEYGLSEYVQSDSYINYRCALYELEVKWEPTPNTPTFSQNLVSVSPEFGALLNERDSLLKRPRNGHPVGLPFSFYSDYVGRVMDFPFYFPTERGLQSLFSLGKSSLQNISDVLFNQLSKIAELTQHFSGETEISPLNVYYKFDGNRALVRKKGQIDFSSLSNGASGFQYAIPIVLAIKYYSEFKQKNKTFIIEEPELSLFPASQSNLISFLVESNNRNSNSFFLNTHSPYILTSLNNAMYAHQVGKVNRRKAEQIRKKETWLDPNDISAYMLTVDGTCVNIFDTEEKLIKAELIDEISNDLNREFDSLIELEMEING